MSMKYLRGTVLILGRVRNYSTKINHDEMHHFNALALTWWDVDGPQRILHKMNLLRMDFIFQTVRNGLKLNEHANSAEDEVYVPPYSPDLLPSAIKRCILQDQELRRDEILNNNKLSVLDVGCGGGILSESLARLSFIKSVLGIDLSEDVLNAAKLHKSKDPLLTNLDYKLVPLEDINKKFNIITMFEMLEHVDFPAQVLSEGLKKLEVDGWLFLSTINRDFVSWFTTIFMGEHLLRIVPVGTHTLDKYINQTEIKDWLEKNKDFKHNYQVVDAKGCIYLPAYGWKFTDSPNVGNYFMAIRRIG